MQQRLQVGHLGFVGRNQVNPVDKNMRMTAIAIEGEDNAAELLEKEQKKQEYKAFLAAQIAEKEEKKKMAKQKEAEREAREMNDFANYYRIGARNQGGGSPIRDREGNVVTQHNPFSSQGQ